MTNREAQVSKSPRPVTPRKVRFPFDPDVVPKRWLADNIVVTQIVNGVSLLFPAGERFFVRSVKRYLDRVDDPELREQIRGFFGQEGRHAHEHERHAEMLEAQGYELRAFLADFERSLKWLETRFPESLSLAGTAAAEHYTAIMAEDAFSDGAFLNDAHPVMRELLLWHAAEEIEHKAVAFDVLASEEPSYALRMAGLFMATVVLGYWWQRATRMLLKQDGLSGRDALRELAKLGDVGERRGILRHVFLRGIREYMRRDFHPWDNDNMALVEGFLAELDQRLDRAA